MVGTPAEPPSSASGGGAGDGDGEQAPAGDKRCGVVAIARHRKDDGRALILYTRVDRGEA